MSSFDTFGHDSVEEVTASDRPFDEDYSTYDPSSFDADSYSGIHAEHDEVAVDEASDSPLPYGAAAMNPSFSQSPFSGEVSVSNGSGNHYNLGADEDGIFASDGAVLPPPDQMREERYAIREWRRENAIRLAEKENLEKEMQNQVIMEAEEFKDAFYEKRKLIIETNKTQNREKEKVFLTNQEMFHKEAYKHYWKAIAELIPYEVPNIEKRRGKKEQEKKPSIIVVQGPKPGKPTDLSRMRHILVKLKHSPPPHMIPPPPASAKDGKDVKPRKEGATETTKPVTSSVSLPPKAEKEAAAQPIVAEAEVVVEA